MDMELLQESTNEKRFPVTTIQSKRSEEDSRGTVLMFEEVINYLFGENRNSRVTGKIF